MAQKKEKLTAELREEFGKGAARRLRRESKIPAVVYGLKDTPHHVSVEESEILRILRHRNAVIELTIGSDEYLVLARDPQRDVVTRRLEHVDLLEIDPKKRVTVDVAIHIDGESAPGTTSQLQTTQLHVEVSALDIPEQFNVSIDGRDVGQHVFAGDIELPEGVTLLTAEDQLIVNIAAIRVSGKDELGGGAEGDTAEGAEGTEGGDAPAEGASEGDASAEDAS